MSISLDGFAAGAGVSVEHPMGHDRGLIHDWMFNGKTDREAKAWEEEQFAGTGALIMGSTTFEVGVGPWGGNPTFHAPCFVVSHHSREMIVKEGGTSYTFVIDGIESALAQAKAAAATKDVVVMGGANIARQFIRAGLLDEMRIHLVPVLLGRRNPPPRRPWPRTRGPGTIRGGQHAAGDPPPVPFLDTAPPRPLTSSLPAWLAGRSMRAYAGRAPGLCLAALRRRKVHRECVSGCP